MTDGAFRRELAARYHDVHARYASSSVYGELTSVWPYYEVNYRDHVADVPRSVPVLEIGPGHGSLLAWLRSIGFTELTGVDSSPGDVAFANDHLGVGTVVEADALDFVQARAGSFGLVIMKAVLEHLPRDRVLALLQSSGRALLPDGLLLVDVPNMDWLLASHERYMDLTHEGGFTRESLRALLLLVFDSVQLRGSVPGRPTGSQRLLRRPLISFLRRVFYVLGEGASDVLFESRSLVAVARRPRLTR